VRLLTLVSCDFFMAGLRIVIGCISGLGERAKLFRDEVVVTVIRCGFHSMVCHHGRTYCISHMIMIEVDYVVLMGICMHLPHRVHHMGSDGHE
jgi:hypothetical protein